MKISEIFLSIDGEGKRTGLPTIFIRKNGCNLRCTYCDSRYTYDRDCLGEDMTVSKIMDKVSEVGDGCKSVTYTGGEPLYASKDGASKEEIEELIRLLSWNGYDVNIETDGAVDISPYLEFRPNIWFTMDYKSISSGMSKKMIDSNLKLLDENDVLKFVVGTKDDLDQMRYIIQHNNIKAQIYVSPVFGMIKPVDLVNYTIENRLFNVKTQVQLHKIIWDPNKRGV